LRVLVVNAGSSSVKLRLLGPDDALLAERDLSAPQSRVDPAELLDALSGMERPDVVGHRVVHGGRSFSSAVVVDEAVRRELESLVDLAPLHQPKSLAALDAVSGALPDVPAVACFDTAFHSGLPDAAATYALPGSLRERFGIRRYGFHGLSHAYASRRSAALAPGASRVVTCHLGAGASLCAVLDGRSVDTTMGFTPLEGLVMATRSGNVDPGLLLWLLERERMNERELAEVLERSSGLLGLAGTADMREVLSRAASDDAAAALALDVYVHRLRAGIASMAASLGGLEALVFTGGVGENSALVRSLSCSGLGFLGVSVEPGLNDAIQEDGPVGAPDASVSTLVVFAREDLEIARQVRELLADGRQVPPADPD
jgi:acetate kinase